MPVPRGELPATTCVSCERVGLNPRAYVDGIVVGWSAYSSAARVSLLIARLIAGVLSGDGVYVLFMTNVHEPTATPGIVTVCAEHRSVAHLHACSPWATQSRTEH
ncbi:hypothetical protein Bbelb_190360 [Branchiostoma belcheri]|nr:hypothetical protein Bbelb_190360 [Branchiostoma belcheri]